MNQQSFQQVFVTDASGTEHSFSIASGGVFVRDGALYLYYKATTPGGYHIYAAGQWKEVEVGAQDTP